MISILSIAAWLGTLWGRVAIGAAALAAVVIWRQVDKSRLRAEGRQIERQATEKANAQAAKTLPRCSLRHVSLRPVSTKRSMPRANPAPGMHSGLLCLLTNCRSLSPAARARLWYTVQLFVRRCAARLAARLCTSRSSDSVKRHQARPPPNSDARPTGVAWFIGTHERDDTA